MMGPSFNLVLEPWIPVRGPDGEHIELGLLEALVRAHEFAGLDVDYPTQEPSLLRLLLAVCYRALCRPRSERDWHELWSAPTLPEAEIRAYLDAWGHRFDLFDRDVPFFQVPGLELQSGKPSPAQRLVPYLPSGNNVPLLIPLAERDVFTLTPAEAARWLIERHQWGTTSDRGGARNNPFLNNGRDVPATGYVGFIGFVAPLGATLKETLALNLVPLDGRWTSTAQADLPAWERDPDGPVRAKRKSGVGGKAPAGICDLYTWQGRRIRLLPGLDGKGDTVVSQVIVCAGDDVTRDSTINIDPHTGWGLTKDGEHYPLRAKPGQQVWRSLASLLALGDTRTGLGASRAPVLSWLARIEETVPAVVTLLTTSANYEKNAAILGDILADRLAVSIAILRQEDLAVGEFVVACAEVAEGASHALGLIAEAPYLREQDGEFKLPRDDEETKRRVTRAKQILAERLFAAIDAPFRGLAARLSNDGAIETERGRWRDTVEQAVRREAERELATLPTSQALAAAVASRRSMAKLRSVVERFSPTKETHGTEAE